MFAPASNFIVELLPSAVSSALPNELVNQELGPLMTNSADEFRVVLPPFRTISRTDFNSWQL
jgi:hypothetical protein